MPQMNNILYDLLLSITEWKHRSKTEYEFKITRQTYHFFSYRISWLTHWPGFSPMFMPCSSRRPVNNFTLTGNLEEVCSEAQSLQLQLCRGRQLYLQSQKESTSCKQWPKRSEEANLSVSPWQYIPCVFGI